ncbi:unnamed protein product [Soboliphyme baturini]|uniref:Secreted protein n=1 Tax=Soboliphyme baturini TaxID=241478 RepID=A0A183J4X8_9BILA|nr:unnamed protein product [Soboliphyme baturini]
MIGDSLHAGACGIVRMCHLIMASQPASDLCCPIRLSRPLNCPPSKTSSSRLAAFWKCVVWRKSVATKMGYEKYDSQSNKKPRQEINCLLKYFIFIFNFVFWLCLRIVRRRSLQTRYLTFITPRAKSLVDFGIEYPNLL